MDPSVISYSFNSLESVNALPLSKSRCESGGGADEDDFEICSLSWETESVMVTVMGRDKEGLRDLTVMLTEASETSART